MFIYDTLRIGMKYEYFLQPKQMKQIFTQLSSLDNEAIVVVQSDLHSLHNNDWINFSKQYKKPIFFSYITNCYASTSLSEKEEPFLFLAKNQNEYKILKRLKCYFDNQFLSHLDTHAITFLERIGIYIFQIDFDRKKMCHLGTSEVLNLSPFIPIQKESLPIPEHLFNSTQPNFDSPLNNINLHFNKWIKECVHLVDWEEKEYNNNDSLKQRIIALIDWNKFTDVESEYIHAELNWLHSQKLTPLLYLSAILSKDKKTIRFEQSFRFFHTSYALGLIKKDEIINKEIKNIQDNFIENFDLSVPYTDDLFFLKRCQSIMDEVNYSVKLPVHNKSISFRSILQMHPQMHDNIENLEFLKDLMNIKKDYDSKSFSEKETFLCDMKLYFLFRPELKDIFKDSIKLTEEIMLQNSHSQDKFAIFRKNSEVSKINILLLDYQAALQKRIPIINVKSRGFSA